MIRRRWRWWTWRFRATTGCCRRSAACCARATVSRAARTPSASSVCSPASRPSIPRRMAWSATAPKCGAGPADRLQHRLRHRQLCHGDVWVRGGVADHPANCGSERGGKPETRRPRAERRPKSEIRRTGSHTGQSDKPPSADWRGNELTFAREASARLRISALRIPFGFRSSAFGFTPAIPVQTASGNSPPPSGPEFRAAARAAPPRNDTPRPGLPGD